MESMKEKILQCIYLAEQIGRYVDMIGLIKSLVQSGMALSEDERSLLSFSFKVQIDELRKSWREVYHLEITETDEKKVSIAREYRKKIQQEQRDVCTELLCLVDRYLEQHPADGDAKGRAYFDKLRGDYFRYLAEVVEDERPQMAKESMKAYESGLKTARSYLPVLNPTRLGLVLNCTVLHFGIYQDRRKACAMAQEAIHDAASFLESAEKSPQHVPEASIAILQVIHTNLAKWYATTQ